MKAKRKHVKVEKEKWIATTIFPSLILLTAIFAYSLMSQTLGQNFIEPDLQFKPENANSQFKAVIVDHLSLTFPNQNFMETVADLLVNAGYTVDYFSGEKVTVEFYRSLPTRGYDIAVLRVHSAVAFGAHEVDLFTSEPYSERKYVYEQLTDQVSQAIIQMSSVNTFGITSKFVRLSMKGKFNNSVIIMMGCNGLTYTDMAEAFVNKGAKAYIGWNASVTTNRTDTATISLLQHLIVQKETVKRAVENTMKEVGPDPTHNSVLGYYPVKSGDYVIPCN
jgi:hypothetical protein